MLDESETGDAGKRSNQMKLRQLLKAIPRITPVLSRAAPRSGVGLNELLGTKPMGWPLAFGMKKKPNFMLILQYVGADCLLCTLSVAAVRKYLKAGHACQNEILCMRIVNS
ncbi:MAG: hypothetical protein NVV60_11945 [Luteimonas sp.]|nr:hypothetical protein [Luteimonas sp.]